MPLAIELAAVWTRTLSCAVIAAEIERNLDVLSSSLRNIPERHRSLRAVCEHSWALLDAHERRVFTRLAVFRAGFSPEAAAAVAGANLPMLDTLVSKSLIRRATGLRYDVHELLRQYAEERLRHDAEEEEVARATAAVGRFYVGFLDHWFPQLARQSITSEALAAIDPELENIRVAWGDILAQSDGEVLRHVAHVIQIVYFVRGPYQALHQRGMV